MEIFNILVFFIFGTVFGSFFNVVGIRSPKHESFTKGRSFCPNCKNTLEWYELIPVISYCIQFGKCRNCKQKISPIYPIIETLTGILFAFSYIKLGLRFELITALLLVSMLMIIFVSDLRYMIIQNKVLLFFLPFFVIFRFLEPLSPWWSPIAGSIVMFALLALIIFVSRGGMGAGDMKLFGVIGIVLGLSNALLAFFLACLIGALIGITLMSLKLVKRRQPIPFGPSIVCGTLIAYFYGNDILEWYMQLLT